MKLVKIFCSRITDDLKQRKLMPLKILFFVHASTILVLYPYLTIHMRELGINVEETAIMSAVTPVVFFIMPPLAGLLADKIGNFRLLLAIFSSLGGFAALLLLLVPVGRVTITYPSDVELLTSCQSGNLTLQNIQDYPCLNLESNLQHTNFTLLSCGFVCEIPTSMSEEKFNSISQKQFYDIFIRSKQNVSQLIYRHSITIPEAYTTETYDKSTSRVLSNDGYFDKKIRKFSERRLFFPSPDLYVFDCETSGSNSACYFGKNDMNYGLNGTSMVYAMTQETILSVELKSHVNNKTYKIASLKNTGFDNEKGVVCKDNYYQEDGRVRVLVDGFALTECSSACASTIPRKHFCSNLKLRKDLDPSLTFWTYLVVRMFIGIISGTAFAMFEGAVISVIRDQRADYGLQRAYGSIGGMISSPISGLLIDYASRGKSYTDFRPAFYLYAVLKVASGVLMLSIDLEFKQPAQNLMKDVVTVFKNIEMIALFIACFVMGTAWGYIESFLFWLLKDMNASSSLMGFTVTVGGVAGLPLLVFSGPIIQKLGHANVLFIGFVFYAIRLLGYSLIYNPWLCLIFEAMESVTSSLSFTAAVTYAAKLSSTSTDTSVQGLLGGVYYGVGKGAGSLVGGFLMKYFGTRLTYQIFAIFTLIIGCIYFLFNKFYLRKRITSSIDNEICDEKKVPADVECTNYIKKDSLDVIKYVDGSELHNVDLSDNEKAPALDHNTTRCKNLDNIDGSSDSGVDNPVYSETETQNEMKK